MNNEPTARPDSPMLKKGEERQGEKNDPPRACYKNGQKYNDGDTYTVGDLTWECEDGVWVFQG